LDDGYRTAMVHDALQAGGGCGKAVGQGEQNGAPDREETRRSQRAAYRTGPAPQGVDGGPDAGGRLRGVPGTASGPGVGALRPSAMRCSTEPRSPAALMRRWHFSRSARQPRSAGRARPTTRTGVPPSGPRPLADSPPSECSSSALGCAGRGLDLWFRQRSQSAVASGSGAADMPP